MNWVISAQTLLGQELANSDPLAKSSPVPVFVLYISPAMMAFAFSSGWKKSERRIIFCDVKTVWNLSFSVHK